VRQLRQEVAERQTAHDNLSVFSGTIKEVASHLSPYAAAQTRTGEQPQQPQRWGEAAPSSLSVPVPPRR